MTTATASDYTLPTLGGRYHFLLRRLHSLTGIIFGGYLVVHLLVNATIAQLGNVYQLQVNKIHELPVLSAIEWIFIYLPILYHTVYGIYITVTGKPNALSYSYGKNWMYVFQRVSAIFIVLFMIFHVFALKYGVFGATLSFNPHAASSTIGRHMQSSWVLWGVVYPLGILASCFHLANGFWTAAITWGVTISKGSQRRWGAACAGIFVLTFVCGMAALVSAVRLDWRSLEQKAPQETAVAQVVLPR